MSSGCGCKEVYTLPHSTYPYSSCICSFSQQHPYFFVHFCKCFSFLFLSFFCNLCNFLRSINTCYSRSCCIYIHVPV